MSKQRLKVPVKIKYDFYTGFLQPSNGVVDKDTQPCKLTPPTLSVTHVQPLIYIFNLRKLKLYTKENQSYLARAAVAVVAGVVAVAVAVAVLVVVVVVVLVVVVVVVVVVIIIFI